MTLIEDTLRQLILQNKDDTSGMVQVLQATIVTIETLRDKLEKANRKSAFLDALVGAGVDNWEGYSEAINMLEETDDE